MTFSRSAIGVTLLLAVTGPIAAQAQVSEQTLSSISTPNTVETRLGTLEFKDGAPSEETLQKVYDNLDFTHAFEAFVNTMQGVSIEAIRNGFTASG
jgi:hypothetical protein